MTLMAVDLDKNGKPTKWMVENSWGAGAGYQGHLIMTDEWFNEYTFRLVVETKYVTKALESLETRTDPPAGVGSMFCRRRITNRQSRCIDLCAQVFQPTLLKNVCEHKRNYGYFP